MTDPRYERFPEWFFDRDDRAADGDFYREPRLVTHIDDHAIAAVGALYDELAITGDVLDLMSSWVSHFRAAPRSLTVLGMNGTELDANPMATNRVVHDLNLEPSLPFAGATFDAVTCCVSVDYLVRPLEVFDDVARVLRPGGRFVCTFSNRLFPTKAIRGWRVSDDATHCAIVSTYFELAGAYEPAEAVDAAGESGHDPLYAVWAVRR
ncbi:MAG TPA: methyltransferase domain-containing protein [Acidimicrobiia bacterium]|jgi:SAM-dependent methyltransferase